MEAIKSVRNKWTNSWVFYHILYWLFIIITLAWDIREYIPYDFAGFFISLLIRVLLQGFLFYCNLFFLIPKIYPKSKLFYWLLLLFSIVIFSYTYRATYFINSEEVSEVPTSLFIEISYKFFIITRTLLYSFLFKFLQGWFEQEKKINQIKVDQLSTELKYLRSQINPHFLFNTLNNLYGLALKKSDKTPEIIMRLSEIMDYMIYESTEAKLPLKKDVDNLINYVEIERIRQGNNASINFNITGEINQQKIIPLLLLPLIENGFTHGINKESNNAFLEVNLHIKEFLLELKVTNNKVPCGEIIKNGHGTGVQNLKKRLELFYPKRYVLNISENENSFTAYLKIELL